MVGIISNELNDSDWRTLIKTIRENKCILMLGPEITTECYNGKQMPLMEALSYELAQKLQLEESNCHNVYQIAERYESSSRSGRNYLEEAIGTFYDVRKEYYKKEIYSDLAELPFSLIISSSHDDFLYEALKRKRNEVHYEYYNIYGNSKETEYEGSPATPFYYNLYGSIKQPDSLVLTENDLLKFLVCVISNNPRLPGYISNQLQKDQSLLFLGFGLKEWYFRILLHVLSNVERKNCSFALEKFYNAGGWDQNSIFYYYHGQKINMYDTDFSLFVKELRQRYENSAKADNAYIQIHSENTKADSPKVFICHANEDKVIADEFYRLLEREGFTPWLDKNDLWGGDRWNLEIEKAIKDEINYFIILNSRSLVSKIEGYVNKEIKLALEREDKFRNQIRFIIPIIIDDSSLLHDLKHLQNIDLGDINNFQKLVTTIKIDWARRKKYQNE